MARKQKRVTKSMSAYTSWVEQSTFKLKARCRNINAELIDTYSNYRHNAHSHACPTDHMSELLQQ